MIDVDFDHVFTVTDTGEIVDGPAGVYAPDVWHDDDEDVIVSSRERWSALTGYTGQYGYNGAVLHASEYFGGGLARDVLATPGTYVVVVVSVLPDDDDPEPEPAGWTVLRLDEEGTS